MPFQFAMGMICFTNTFLLKMSHEISSRWFLKFWFLYKRFYCMLIKIILFIIHAQIYRILSELYYSQKLFEKTLRNVWVESGLHFNPLTA